MATDYEANFEVNLNDLLVRIKSGSISRHRRDRTTSVREKWLSGERRDVQRELRSIVSPPSNLSRFTKFSFQIRCVSRASALMRREAKMESVAIYARVSSDKKRTRPPVRRAR